MDAVSHDDEPSTRARLSRRAPWRRFAIGIGIAAASVAVLYLVAINVFLRTGLLRNALSADPVAFRVDYRSAYSIVPGRIHVDGLAIRGRDSSIEWILTLDDCDFRVAFRDLFHKRFHAFHVRANGFAIRVRLRIPPADATPEIVAALPPVPGFADPPYAGAKPAPLTDAHYNLWMVQLDDVEVQHVREVWIHTVRGQGDMRVRGRWVFRPLRWLEVGPASVEVATLDVATGNRPLARDLHGSIDATVHPFDLRKPKGLEILEYLSTDARLLGTAIDSNLLTAVSASSDVRFTRGEGPVDVQLLADHGRLVSGTRVRAESADTEAIIEKLVFDASVRAALDVDGGSATFRAQASDCRASAGPAVQARAASVEATIVTRHLDAAHAFDDGDFAVAIHRAETSYGALWLAR